MKMAFLIFVSTLFVFFSDSVNSKTNVLHIRFFAEASAINSSFSILFTAYRDKPAGNPCEEDEFDCEDAKCIWGELRCNHRINCQFRWDEDNCFVVQQGQSEHIIIIIIVFGLILGGMMLTFVINCMRKIARDQKIIREHIRQSRESEIDAIGKRDLKKSMENLNRLKKIQMTEVEVYEQREQNSDEKTPQVEPEEYTTITREYDDQPYEQGNDVEINTRGYQVYPSIRPESRMCETAVQTRESLFQSIHLIKPPQESQSHHILHVAEPRLSSFGHNKGATVLAAAAAASSPSSAITAISTSQMQQQGQQTQIDRGMTPAHHNHNLPQTTVYNNNNQSSKGIAPHQHHHHHHLHQLEKHPNSAYSQHENERKSAPDVIIMTSVQR